MSDIKDNLQEVKQDYAKSNTPWSKAFEAFTDKYKCEDKFLLQMDGIIDKNKWEQYDKKVLFVLKDGWRSVDKITGAILNNNYIAPVAYWWGQKEHRSEYNTPTPRIMCDWLEAIYEAFFDEQYPEDNILRSSAYMNLSKIASHTVYTQPGVIKRAVLNDSKELYQQFKEIAPKIVVYCNSSDYFFEILRRGELGKFDGSRINSVAVEEFKKNRLRLISKNEIVIQPKGRKISKINIWAYDKIIIFHSYHPVARKPYQAIKDDFKYLINKHKAELLRILNN